MQDLKTFQSFLTRNFKSLPLDKIKPSSNQPAFLYGSAKTHKFANTNDITKENLKLRPIVSTVGTYYYETAKHLASYLAPLTSNEYNIKSTTDFSSRLEDRKLDDDEILVSYDVSSLFTEVPLDDTIDYIIEEIYTHNKLPPLGSKLLFKRLLLHVTKNTVFSFNNRLYRQIDGCGMGNPLSPVLANIFMAKLERDVVHPYNPPFYDRYVDDIFSKRKRDEPDDLLDSLNNYHDNIKFTVEKNPDHFLDTAFSYDNDHFERRVYRKPGKYPTHWSSQVPTNWKRNAINGALHRAKRISTNFNEDVKQITETFLQAGYPKRFIQSTVDGFLRKQQEEEPLIPDFLFDESKKVFLKLPYCTKNEHLARRFLSSLHRYTDGNYKFIILWQTRKIKSLFKLKDENKHPSSVIYKLDCSCGETYIGETKRNFTTRQEEHENTQHNSQPAQHFKQNQDHEFTWNIIHVEQSIFKRRIKEGLLIAKYHPTLNKQVKCFIAKLYPSGIS